MSRETLLKLSVPVLAAGTLLIVGPGPAPEASVGAPWLTLEVPANPMDDATRDAALVVRAYYHDRPAGYELVGTAEGLVDGERRSVPLEMRSTGRAGVFTVRQSWPEHGHWVLRIGLEGRGPTLLAEIGPDGGVRAERYLGAPTNTVALRSVRVVGGAVDDGRIDAALHAMATRSDD